eukprot:gene9254-19211_t
MVLSCQANPITLSKILLKFEKLRNVLKNIVAVFNTFCDGKEGLNLKDLQQVMQLLHGELSKDEVMDLFNFVDIDESKVINLKEFLVALTVGYVLEVIPSLAPQGSEPRSPLSTDNSDINGVVREDSRLSLLAFMGQSAQTKELLNLIVYAYLLFDPVPEGFIRKEAVEQLLEEDGRKCGTKTIMETRWREMDWDESGTIDFAEFVYSFSSWVDLEEDMA